MATRAAEFAVVWWTEVEDLEVVTGGGVDEVVGGGGKWRVLLGGSDCLGMRSSLGLMGEDRGT